MASAEKLLHEAQYAFQCISFGESRDNNKNRSRATSLCNKIIRKYPGSMEASEAHALLRRLGEEAYSSKMATRHRHIPQSAHHQTQAEHHRPRRTPSPRKRAPESQRTFITGDGVETLDWSALMSWLFSMPKFILGMIIVGAVFLFGILGPFLFLPLIAFVFLTGPFRKSLKPEQRRQMNEFIVRVNEHVNGQSSV